MTEYICPYAEVVPRCLRTGPFHIDHVVPISRGGRDRHNNMLRICRHCNLSKHAKLPSEWLGDRVPELVRIIEEREIAETENRDPRVKTTMLIVPGSNTNKTTRVSRPPTKSDVIHLLNTTLGNGDNSADVHTLLASHGYCRVKPRTFETTGDSFADVIEMFYATDHLTAYTSQCDELRGRVYWMRLNNYRTCDIAGTRYAARWLFDAYTKGLRAIANRLLVVLLDNFVVKHYSQVRQEALAFRDKLFLNEPSLMENYCSGRVTNFVPVWAQQFITYNPCINEAHFLERLKTAYQGIISSSGLLVYCSSKEFGKMTDPDRRPVKKLPPMMAAEVFDPEGFRLTQNPSIEEEEAHI